MVTAHRSYWKACDCHSTPSNVWLIFVKNISRGWSCVILVWKSCPGCSTTNPVLCQCAWESTGRWSKWLALESMGETWKKLLTPNFGPVQLQLSPLWPFQERTSRWEISLCPAFSLCCSCISNKNNIFITQTEKWTSLFTALSCSKSFKSWLWQCSDRLPDTGFVSLLAACYSLGKGDNLGNSLHLHWSHICFWSSTQCKSCLSFRKYPSNTTLLPNVISSSCELHSVSFGSSISFTF